MKFTHYFSVDKIPVCVNDIYQDRIDDFTLMCTPLAMNGIHLLTQKSLKVLNECNGANSIGEIINKIGFEKDYVLGVINTLWQNKLIKIDDNFTEKTEKKNLSNQIDVWFHITNSCNFNCPYCYINKTDESMNKKTGYQAIDNLAISALLYNVPEVRIKFTGGEPLLCFNFIKELVTYGKKWKNKGVKFSFHILTNGTLISKQIVKYLREENITVSVSLDGVNSGNDNLRYFKNGKGSFNRIEKNIKLLKEYEIRPYILTTITALNLYNIPDLTMYLLDSKLSFRFSLYRELGVSEKSLKNYNGEVIKILHQCYDICENNLPKEDFLSVHQLCDIKLKKSRKRVCGIGTKGVSIGHRGEIAICQAVFNNPVGHIDKDDSLTVIRNQNQFLAKENIVDNYENCKDCIWRYVCAGGCAILTKLQYGKFNTYSPYCDVFKDCIPRLIRIIGLQIIQQSQ